MIFRGVSWRSLVRGLHIAGPFKSGHELRAAGHRGQWEWMVIHKEAPLFEATECAKGQAGAKLAAMGAAIDALTEILKPGREA